MRNEEYEALTLSIDIYYGYKTWAQGKYLVHGYNDVLWTYDLNEALSFLKSQIEENDERIKNYLPNS